jgi:hypothetical protein
MNKILVVFMFGLLLVPMISALDWTTTLDYNSEDIRSRGFCENNFLKCS